LSRFVVVPLEPYPDEVGELLFFFEQQSDLARELDDRPGAQRVDGRGVEADGVQLRRPRASWPRVVEYGD
jgi:hypothetical protein